MYSLDDTIAAIASAPGGAARGIVRLSGQAVEQCLEACFRAKSGYATAPLPTNLRSVPGEGLGVRVESPPSAPYPYHLPKGEVIPASPRIIEGELHLSGLYSPLPCEVYLWPAGRSYTGQKVAEFHTFGSPPLLESLLKTLCAAGARLAEPGEFTLRAFLSGRIDLTQAEAVLGVIDAADPRQFQTALGQLAGGLAGPLHILRGDLLELLAQLEAGFDFAEEELSFISTEQLDRQLASHTERAAALLEKMSSRNLVETAAKAVLVGRPNTGKSSLFNALTKKSGALVSSTPGTTRDYLSAELDLDGVKCQLIDTAGIGFGKGDRCILPERPEGCCAQNAPVPFSKGTDRRLVGRGAGGEGCGANEIDSAAQSAARGQHQQATIRILCIDATTKLNKWEQEQIELGDSSILVIALTKIDATPVGQVENPSYSLVATSSATGEGMDLLRGELRQKILSLGNAGGEVVAGTAARCRESLISTVESLNRAWISLEQRTGEEFIAGEIRLALEELGRVAGAVYTDDVLDRIFSRFCVGK